MPWNELATKITGELVTAAEWVDARENMLYLEEVAYAEFTADVSITGTSDVQIVSAGAVTFEAVPHLVEFQCSTIQAGGSGALSLKLRDGTTLVDTLGPMAASNIERFVHVTRRFTPTAASHTYNIAAANAVSQTSTAFAAAAGTSTRMPGFIRITRVPT